MIFLTAVSFFVLFVESRKLQISQELVIIDVDAGVDDAEALLFALYQEFSRNVHILGITCVGGGNTILDNVVSNVLRVLKISNAEHVPVYKGCHKSILSNQSEAGPTYGHDGFGSISNRIPVHSMKIRNSHAVKWMYEMVNTYPGRITFIALGPLTNLAMAQIMFDDFSAKLKKVQLLGGSTIKSDVVKPEFNLRSDPEAAHVIFNKFVCPITVLDRETYKKHAFSQDWYNSRILNGNSSVANFMKDLDASTFAEYGANGFAPADLLAMAVFLLPELVQMREFHTVNIELADTALRGSMTASLVDQSSNATKIEFIRKFDQDKLKRLMNDLLYNFVLDYD